MRRVSSVPPFLLETSVCSVWTAAGFSLKDLKLYGPQPDNLSFCAET